MSVIVLSCVHTHFEIFVRHILWNSVEWVGIFFIILRTDSCRPDLLSYETVTQTKLNCFQICVVGLPVQLD